MNNELNTVLANTYTSDDAYMRLSLARQFVEQIFFTPNAALEDWRVSLEKFLLSRDAEPSTRAALAAWGEAWFRGFNPENISDKFNAIEQMIEELPRLTIVVPVGLPPAEVSRIGQWGRINVDPQAIIVLRVDPSSVGGCFIIWQGLYLDISLRYFFIKQRDALLDMVHSYQVAK